MFLYLKRKGEKWKKLPILIILIYCNLLRSYTLALVNGHVGQDYVTEMLASLMYPNYKYFLLTVNVTAINTRTMFLTAARTVRKIRGGNSTDYFLI
jgi:hypothetical protein